MPQQDTHNLGQRDDIIVPGHTYTWIVLLAAALSALILFTTPQTAAAQTNTNVQQATSTQKTKLTPPPVQPNIKARAVNATTIKTDQGDIKLWGLEEPDGIPPLKKLHGRVTLEKILGGFPIQCEFKTAQNGAKSGQCVSYQDIDIGLYMIQEGYALADRTAVYGTIFEEPYLMAESQARSRKSGIWAGLEKRNSQSDNSVAFDNLFILIIGCASLATILLIGLLIYRNLQRLVELQTESIEIFKQDQRIKQKEKYVVASMLSSEVEANRNKIDAYLAIYREMLEQLLRPDITPKYTENGDIVQRQPVLNRNIFDNNIDKLEQLSPKLASKLTHFYARIKSNPDYITLDADMPREKAQKIVTQVVDNAERLNKMGDEILEIITSYVPKAPTAQQQAETIEAED